MTRAAAVLGAGRIGRPIALTFALAGFRVLLIDLKLRTRADARELVASCHREMARDLALMAEEDVIKDSDAAPALDRIEHRTTLDGIDACEFVQEALPEVVALKRETLARLHGRLAETAIVAST